MKKKKKKTKKKQKKREQQQREKTLNKGRLLYRGHRIKQSTSNVAEWKGWTLTKARELKQLRKSRAANAVKDKVSIVKLWALH